MSQQSPAEFFAKIEQDPALQAQLGEITEVEQLVAFAAAHGCDLTAEVAQSLVRSVCQQDESGELDDAALEGIAGGGSGTGYFGSSAYSNAIRYLKKYVQKTQTNNGP